MHRGQQQGCTLQASQAVNVFWCTQLLLRQSPHGSITHPWWHHHQIWWSLRHINPWNKHRRHIYTFRWNSSAWKGACLGIFFCGIKNLVKVCASFRWKHSCSLNVLCLYKVSHVKPELPIRVLIQPLKNTRKWPLLYGLGFVQGACWNGDKRKFGRTLSSKMSLCAGALRIPLIETKKPKPHRPDQKVCGGGCPQAV